MHNLLRMQVVEAINHLVEDGPDFSLLHVGLGALAVVDFRLQVTSICELHHDAECLGCLFDEGLLVAGDVWVVDGGKDPHFVNRIIFLLLRQLGHFDLNQKLTKERKVPSSKHILFRLISSRL